MHFTDADTIGSAKRTAKATRHVSTADRRTMHNAAERQRRKTLNDRFLTLASMLSDLGQVGRPSKSAIVNSAIAHLRASRRHRILAVQQLRMMKNEADALRHQVNEWLPRRAELEFDATDTLEGAESEEDEQGSAAHPSPCPENAPAQADDYAPKIQLEKEDMFTAQVEHVQHQVPSLKPAYVHPVAGYPNTTVQLRSNR
ncbi:hypothetical protein R3P38DRAFT_3223730 [Favolaschia claudopus]|uniref:BHLH domain-containing protein n=1 Tax=Favolaschia claudopus TaxID=2862362 RepID=A0AAV9ZWF2_9AGAR